ncbi:MULTISPECIES: YoaK family protein [unclassified Streptomyces]|uniref:YoaK family protein n=1 Tax=unclassified Streptomyces TaxID=2593676 RepID=UPI00381336ED
MNSIRPSPDADSAKLRARPAQVNTAGGPRTEAAHLAPVLLLVLTVLSGMIDAVSVIALGHVFVANMTGNLVFVSLGLAGVSGFSLRTSLVALGGFVAGVLLCRATVGGLHPPAALIRAGAVCETALLGTAAGLAGWGAPHGVLVAVCAVALGLQNGMAGRLRVSGLTTTVMTRTLVGLIGGVGRHPSPLAVRQVLSVLALIAGAVAGALVVLHSGPAVGIAAAAGCALFVAAVAAVAAVSGR